MPRKTLPIFLALALAPQIALSKDVATYQE